MNEYEHNDHFHVFSLSIPSSYEVERKGISFLTISKLCYFNDDKKFDVNFC